LNKSEMKMKLNYIISILLAITLLPVSSFGQDGGEVVISGKVISAFDDEGLVGATVVEMDAQNRIMNATITDFNGQYVLKVKNTNNNLVFSFIGFKPITQKIGGRTIINVTMEEDKQAIDEVEIVAQKRHSEGSFAIPQREISGAVQTFNMEKMEGMPTTSIDDALQGRIAGLDIVANSGDPGSGSSMRIRGSTSINANAEPLIVVNDIPFQMDVDPTFDFANATEDEFATLLSINPDDIEEITVLKDAASCAVWGVNGANGVLVIKTKRGAKGPTRVQYSYRLTGTVQPDGLQMLNGDDYTMMMKQALFNPQQNEDAANVQELMYNPNFSEYQNFNNNTNWIDEVTQIGFKHDHFISLAGGGERASYRVSGGFLTQTGTIIGQQLDRASSRAYFEYDVSDRIKFISDISFTFTDNDKNYKPNDDFPTILGIAYRKMPNVSVYEQDANGNITGNYYNIDQSSSLHDDQKNLYNPVALAHLATNNTKNYRIIPTLRLRYDILDPEVQRLTYDVITSFDINNTRSSSFLPSEASNATWNNDAVNRSLNGDSESTSIFIENNLTWIARFSNPNHSLTVQAKNRIRTGTGASQYIGKTNLPGDFKDATIPGYFVPNADFSTSRWQYRSLSNLARAHYAYKGRYVLSATVTSDGSTQFGEGNKFGTFPAVSAKWIMSDEPFMQSTNRWLSFLALRPSWGIGGNPPGQEYLHYSLYSAYGNYMGMSSFRPTNMRLDNLQWETSTQWNFGMDLGLFNDKFVLDFNLYKTRTEDLLFKDTRVSSTSGYTKISKQNVGTMDNQGYEINLQTNNLIKTNDLRIDFNLNMANNRNVIIELRDDIMQQYNTDYGYDNGAYMTRLQEGHAYGAVYGFRYKGVYQYNDYVAGSQESAPVARDAHGNVITDSRGNPLPMYFAYGQTNEYQFRGGDAIYEDINNDGTIDELDIVYLGNTNPKLTGGFGTNIVWKQFGMTAFFNFRYGNKVVNKNRMYSENMYNYNNQSTSVNWRWRKDGDVTDMPRALYQYGYNWLGSDRYVEDGSFLRFKYLSFNYSVPRANLKKYKMESLRFFLTFNNLHIWTNYSGVDPEIGYGALGVSEDKGQTPRTRDCMFGVSVTF